MWNIFKVEQTHITHTHTPWKTIYEVIYDDSFEKYDVKFPNEFQLKCKKEFNESRFIPVESKKAIQQVGIEHGFFTDSLK